MRILLKLRSAILKSPYIIKDRKIRIAVVGCGRISANHFAAIEKLSEYFELVGVCDGHAETLKQAMDQTHAPGYATIEELIQTANPDIVTLCTPSGLHAKQTIQIAELGKHVITEKPMATRWADGLEMINVCDAMGVRLFVVKQNRRNATLQLLKHAVQQNRFGKIYMVNVNVFWTRPQSYYDQAKWRGTWEFDGGAFMNQASHYVDLLEWIIGPVQSVQAMMGTLGRHVEVEDTGVLNIRWRSGAMGSMNVTMLTYPKNLEGSITILGEKGTVRIGGVAVNEIQQWEFADKSPEDEAVTKASYETTSVYGSGHYAYYENVVQTLRGESEAETDGREGLKSLEILVAAYLSARDDRTVSLPLEI